DRRWHHAGPRLQGHAHGWAHGRRPGHRQAPERGAGRRRAQSAHGARSGARRAQRGAAGAEGEVTMPETTMLSAKGTKAGKGELTAKAEEGALRVVEGFDLPQIGTRAFAERLAGWDADGKVLVVLPARDPVVERSCRNLREVRVLLADSLNVVDLLEADTIVFTADALARAQEVYG